MQEAAHLIILNFNNLDVVKDCYESLIKNNDYPAYLLFVDQGSTDGSLEYLRRICQYNPYNTLIELPFNVGTTKGWNIGIRYLRQFNPAYIGFINSDITVEKGWLSPLVKLLSKYPDAGAVSSQLRDPSNKSFIQNDGADINNPCHYLMGDEKKIKHRGSDLSEWIHMGATLFKYEVFQEIGLFDENMFIYSSDFDIQIRMKLAGFMLLHCSGSIAYHRTFHTCKKLGKSKVYQEIMRKDGSYCDSKWGKPIHDWFISGLMPKNLNENLILANDLKNKSLPRTIEGKIFK